MVRWKRVNLDVSTPKSNDSISNRVINIIFKKIDVLTKTKKKQKLFL